VIPSRLFSVVLASGDPLGHNYDYSILSWNGWAIISNHILTMLIVTIFMIWWMPRVARAVAKGDTGTSHDYVTKGVWAHMIEVICIFFREDICRPVMGPFTDRYVGVIWTFFYFILFCNLIGLLPTMDISSLVYKAFAGSGEAHVAQVEHMEYPVDSTGEETHITLGENDLSHNNHLASAQESTHENAELGGEHTDNTEHAEGGETVWRLGPFVLFQDLAEPETASKFDGLGGTPTGNIAVTFALALIAILVVIGSAIKNLGFIGFLHHLTLDAPMGLWPLTVLLELIGLAAKPFALMVRLYANMTAGHLMLASILGFTSMAWNGFVTYLAPGATATNPLVDISIGGLIGFLPLAIGSIAFAVAIGLLELLVAFIQAFVFAFLTAMFISMFLPHEHEHAHGHEDEPNAPKAAVAF